MHGLLLLPLGTAALVMVTKKNKKYWSGEVIHRAIIHTRGT